MNPLIGKLVITARSKAYFQDDEVLQWAIFRENTKMQVPNTWAFYLVRITKVALCQVGQA